MKFNFTYDSRFQGAFEKKLKSKIVNHFAELGESNTLNPFNPNSIVALMMKKIISLAQQQNKYSDRLYYKEVDLTYPIKQELFYDIDTALDIYFNHRIHSTTIERFIDQLDKTIKEEAHVYQKEHVTIDTDAEFLCLTQFIYDNWDGLTHEEIQTIFYPVWQASLEYEKNTFSNSPIFSDFIQQWSLERTDYNNWMENNITKGEHYFKRYKDYDYVNNLAKTMLSSFFLVDSYLKKNQKNSHDFFRHNEQLVDQLQANHANISQFLPIGWDESNKHVEQENHDDFEGLIHHDPGTFSFPISVSLSQVKFSEENNQVSPLSSLVEAISRHAYHTTQNNNNIAILNEFKHLKEHLSTPFYYKDIIFSLKEDIKQYVSHPIAQLILDESIKNTPHYDKKEVAQSLKKPK